jgi:hypothetical protein
MASSRPVNKNTSSSAVTRAEKAQISELRVVTENNKAARSNSSLVWRYYGSLYHVPDDSKSAQVIVDAERIYCR